MGDQETVWYACTANSEGCPARVATIQATVRAYSSDANGVRGLPGHHLHTFISYPPLHRRPVLSIFG